jgi:hypothetical protein
MHKKLEEDLISRQGIIAQHFDSMQYSRDSAYRSTEILNRLQKILPPKTKINSIFVSYYPKSDWNESFGQLLLYARTAWGKTPKDLAPYLEKLERFLGECRSQTNDDASELIFEFQKKFPMRVEPRNLRISLYLVWQKPSDSTCQIVVTGYTTRNETQYVERKVPTYQIVCP